MLPEGCLAAPATHAAAVVLNPASQLHPPAPPVAPAVYATVALAAPDIAIPIVGA